MAFWFAFFSIVFTFAGLSGSARCVNNGDFKGISNLVAVFAISGVLGVIFVAINLVDVSANVIGAAHLAGWGVLIGLLGKEVLVALKAASARIVSMRLGIPSGIEEKEED